ncbi:DUF4065 domain-containing protein [Candidatus Sumerlaeota bacterium]|nr:DUF4065 domain-containing protein [Candidatus Sumerlaeota bacterium]
MTTAKDVAAYILKKLGSMSTWKLQKLLYYSQAWALVWDEKRLFPDKIKAWANGPVVPSVYALHKGRYRISNLPQGNAENLSDENCATVDAVLKFYGPKPAQWLSDLTHAEKPWKDARAGVPEWERNHSPEITPEAMAEYYGSL